MFYSSTGTSSWCQASKLVASDGASNAYFGYSVSTTGNVIVVGAYAADVNAVVNAGGSTCFVSINSVLLFE